MKRSFDSRVDYSLILPVFCLLVIGVIAIYIAVSHDYPNNVWPILGQQLAWIALGIIFSFVVMFFNTKFLWQSTPYLYGLGLALMVLPLVFYNPSLVAATGAKLGINRWLHTFSTFRIHEDILYLDAGLCDCNFH